MPNLRPEIAKGLPAFLRGLVRNDRRPRGQEFVSTLRLTPSSLRQLAQRLLSGAGEMSDLTVATAIIEGYLALDADERLEIFHSLALDFGADSEAIRRAWLAFDRDGGVVNFKRLTQAVEPPRQELFRRLIRAPSGTASLIRMREDLLGSLSSNPELAGIDDDLHHLFQSWFNPGFLVLRGMDWNTSAELLEKLIRYEAVHRIEDWDDLRRRLSPADRRCYAFFHPALADDPLIFVEVALTSGIPGSIADLLSADRNPIAAEKATTAVFYSISNCQPGLRGISFGNVLIKQVVDELRRALPALSTFVTLSPVPGFRRALSRQSDLNPEIVSGLAAVDADAGNFAALNAIQEPLMALARDYLLHGKNAQGQPDDAVQRFHLGNGARLERLCWAADLSPKGIAESAGLMVNYLYDLNSVEENREAFASHGIVRTGKELTRAARARSAARV